MSKKQKARVLVTLKCNRKCSYCCNHLLDIKSQMRVIEDPAELVDYKEVMITGGEPGLVMDSVSALTTLLLRNEQFYGKLFLYTAMCDPNMIGGLTRFHGIQFTLHENYTEKDIEYLKRIENTISLYRIIFPGSSFLRSNRLKISPELKMPELDTSCWKTVLQRPMRDETTCIVPVDEDLIFFDSYKWFREILDKKQWHKLVGR